MFSFQSKHLLHRVLGKGPGSCAGSADGASRLSNMCPCSCVVQVPGVQAGGPSGCDGRCGTALHGDQETSPGLGAIPSTCRQGMRRAHQCPGAACSSRALKDCFLCAAVDRALTMMMSWQNAGGFVVLASIAL
jgi:hypothetical protein